MIVTLPFGEPTTVTYFAFTAITASMLSVL